MQFIYRKIFSFRLPGYSLSREHFTHMNLLCSCFCPAHYIVKSPWFQEDFTFFSNFLRSNISPAFYGLSGDKTETNANFLSSSFPISTMPFPIVKAAATVPIPRPSILPSPKKVNNAAVVWAVDPEKGQLGVGQWSGDGWSSAIGHWINWVALWQQDLSSFIFGSVPFRIRYF